jgi:hypothetical protein
LKKIYKVEKASDVNVEEQVVSPVDPGDPPKEIYFQVRDQ